MLFVILIASYLNIMEDNKVNRFRLGDYLPTVHAACIQDYPHQYGMSVCSCDTLFGEFQLKGCRNHYNHALGSYICQQFIGVAVKVCLKLSDYINRRNCICKWRWYVVSVSKLLKNHDGPNEVASIMSTLHKYGAEDNWLIIIVTIDSFTSFHWLYYWCEDVRIDKCYGS